MTDLHVVCPRCGQVNRASAEKLSHGQRPDCGACGAPLFPGAFDARDDAAFARHVARESLPILVDFWADWCGPCKSMAPHFAAAAKTRDVSARFMKVDTEKLRATAQNFNIRSIPTLVLIKGGREIARQSGAIDQSQILRWLDQHGAPPKAQT